MAEYVNVSPQTLQIGDNVLFADKVAGCGCGGIIHRKGSGIFTLKGGTYYIAFSGNVSGANADAPLQLSIMLNGEAIGGGNMISTPAAANALNNVSSFVSVSVPPCCCYTIAVENTGANTLTIHDANIMIQREGTT